VFSKSNWSAPVPGRSKLETTGPSEIVENCHYADIAAAEDGRAPYFAPTPTSNFQRQFESLELVVSLVLGAWNLEL